MPGRKNQKKKKKKKKKINKKGQHGKNRTLSQASRVEKGLKIIEETTGPGGGRGCGTSKCSDPIKKKKKRHLLKTPRPGGSRKKKWDSVRRGGTNAKRLKILETMARHSDPDGISKDFSRRKALKKKRLLSALGGFAWGVKGGRKTNPLRKSL